MESNLSGSGLNNHAVIRLGLLGLSSADPREFGEDNVAVGLLLHSGLLARLFYSCSAALKVLIDGARCGDSSGLWCSSYLVLSVKWNV
jgi:hypothetical protein